MHEIDAHSQLSPAKAGVKSNNIGDFLEEHGIKPTRQRVAIASHMFEQDQHLSAEVILERVNADDSTTNVSKATVYNTLKLFVQEGILKEVALDPQRILFDTNTHHHHHIFNVDTGEIRDINPMHIDLSNLSGLQSGESIDGVDLIVKVSKKKGSDSEL